MSASLLRSWACPQYSAPPYSVLCPPAAPTCPKPETWTGSWVYMRMLKTRQGESCAQGHPTEIRGDTAKTRAHSRALHYTLLGLPKNVAVSELRVPPVPFPHPSQKEAALIRVTHLPCKSTCIQEYSRSSGSSVWKGKGWAAYPSRTILKACLAQGLPWWPRQ